MSQNTPDIFDGEIVKPSDAMHVAVVRALWNSEITGELARGAAEGFARAGLENDLVDFYEVPGCIELTFAASQLIETGLYDAVVVLGCVIRGGTPHFEYVCQSVTQGITMLNQDCDIPVIFGVLTVDCEQDAWDRAGGKMGNKGYEAALTAVSMHNFNVMVKNL